MLPEKFPWAEHPGKLHWPNPDNPDENFFAGFPHLVIEEPSEEQFTEMFDWLNDNLGRRGGQGHSSFWSYRLIVEERSKVYYSNEGDKSCSSSFDSKLVEGHFYVKENLFPMFKLQFM